MTLETKTRLQAETMNAVQELIRLNIDSRDGFRELSQQTEEASLSNIFRELASQRDQQVTELRSIVAASAGDPVDSGSYAAAAHRAWIDLKAALGGGSTAMLTEAERGEDTIRQKYETVLKQTAGSAVNDILQRQHAAVKSSHDRMKAMRDAHRKE